MGETGEYFDMKERQGSMDEMDRDPEDVESLGSRTSSSKFILESCGRSRSHLYPREPSPLHFTHLNSPDPNAFYMPSPLRSHSFEKPRRRRRRFFTSCCCCCCCSLCSVIVTASILLGLTAFIFWLVLRPIHAPRYSIDDVEFRSLSVNAPNSSLNADAVFTITVENQNRRLGFKYEGIGIETSYRGYVFGHSSVGPFSIGYQNVTKLTSEFVVENYFFTPTTVGRNLSADVKLARVPLHVRASAKVRVRVGAITSFALKVFVDCDVNVKPPQTNVPSSVIDKSCKLTR